MPYKEGRYPDSFSSRVDNSDKLYHNTNTILNTPLMFFKKYCENYGIQTELTIKPSGIKITFIKKVQGSVKKRSITISNEEFLDVRKMVEVNNVLMEFCNDFSF